MRNNETWYMSLEGFIIHSFIQTTQNGPRACLLGRLNDGRTFAAVEDRFRPGFYVRDSELHKARSLLKNGGLSWDKTGLRTLDGESVFRVSFGRQQDFARAREVLEREAVRTYEADLSLQQQYLISRRVHGSMRIEGEAREGDFVGPVFLNPNIGPSDWEPRVSALSVDIETDLAASEIRAIGLAGNDPWKKTELRTVLLLGETAEQDWLRTFPDEKSMLTAFAERLQKFDPDIITGWNVADFDFRVIARRFQHFRIPFVLGRSSEPGVFLPPDQGRKAQVILPGRQVIDAMWVVRASPERYEDYRLETVAQAILGTGKALDFADDEDKGATLDRLYREDPVTLSRYCLEDARLVIDILEKTGLLDLTLRRCQLTGINMERAWTSIPVFEHLYIEQLHERGFVAPTPGVDVKPTGGVAGGAILEPHPGLHENVFVFDFKSLYPSIIRTFNIDPLSLVECADAQDPSVIRAPNGACFRREPGILPGLLDRFFENREEARKRGDKLASYVYKIIMNSFYGVLGTPGCRFAAAELAGAITGFGQLLLRWCKDRFEAEGHQVLYGDTDSVFVGLGVEGNAGPGDLHRQGRETAQQITRALADYVRREYAVESQLELEFEKVYAQFFLPSVRGVQGGPVARGRAKGYAGLPVPEREGETQEIEIKGMEAIRRDWTDLAQEFQVRMLGFVFQKKPLTEIQAHIQGLLEELFAGKLDKKLVYPKMLRKPLSEYTKSKPPHAKAAELLGWTNQRGLVRYLWTLEGPQPVSRRTAKIDYWHYVDKQLKPIAGAFSMALGSDMEGLFEANQQSTLF